MQVSDCMGKNRLEAAIGQLSDYLTYTKERFHDPYIDLLNEFAMSTLMDQKKMIKSFASIEDFLGQLALVLDLRQENEPLPSDIRSGKTPEWDMSHYYKNAFGLFDKDVSLKYESEHRQGYRKDNYQYHFLTMYYYRILMDHHDEDQNTASLDADDLRSVTVSMLFCMLYLVNKYNDRLEGYYQSAINKQYDFDGYLERIKHNYKKQGFEYLEVRWDDVHCIEERTIDAIISSNDNNRIITFIGEAGTGKTTALRRLEFQYAKKSSKSFDRLPVFIELKKLGYGDKTIANAVAEVLDIDSDMADQILDNNGLILLLDGLNEIPVTTRAAAVREEIERLYDKNDKILIYLTDRTNKNMTFNLIRGITDYHLHTLTWDDKITYLKANTKEADVRALIDGEIEKEKNGSKSVINRLKTPLMLNVFLNYIKDTKTVPEDVYESYVNRLFERERREQKDIDDPQYFDQLKDALSAIAYLFDRNSFKRIQAAKIIGKINIQLAYHDLDSSRTLELSVKMGILEELPDDTLKFSSSEYVDYFQTNAIVRGIDEYVEDLV